MKGATAALAILNIGLAIYAVGLDDPNGRVYWLISAVSLAIVACAIGAFLEEIRR